MVGFFDEQEFIDEAVELIQSSIPAPAKAIIACSGGVDSMVAATLASKAIGDRLLAVYVDNGLMRKGETEEVEAMMRHMGINYKVASVADEYFDALKGVEDPEQKRKITPASSAPPVCSRAPSPPTGLSPGTAPATPSSPTTTSEVSPRTWA